jgi:hypothetical protein
MCAIMCAAKTKSVSDTATAAAFSIELNNPVCGNEQNSSDRRGSSRNRCDYRQWKSSAIESYPVLLMRHP